MSRGDDDRARDQPAVYTASARMAATLPVEAPRAATPLPPIVRGAVTIDRAAIRGLPYDQLPGEVQEYFRGLSRQELLRDSTYHFWMGSRQPQEARVRAGEAGFAAVRERYGEWAHALAARWREQHPERASQAERKTFDLLAELGHGHPIHDRAHVTYLRERPVAGYYVDIYFPGSHQVIEVFGGAHFGPFFDPDGHRSRSDQVRLEAIRRTDQAVLVPTEPDLACSAYGRTREEVWHFLDKGMWGHIYHIGREVWE